MKMVVKREPFVAALSAASAVVPQRPLKPVLKNALLAFGDKGICEIQATDLEVGPRCRVTVESIKDPASLCLPCHTLAGLLKECTEETVTLETDGVKGIFKVGKDRFEIHGQEAADFPDVPNLGEGAVIPIPAIELGGMIDRTVFAAAREQGRYAINGIHFLYKDKTLEVVATDGRRLAYCKRKLKAEGALDEGVIVPVKMMQEVRKLCAVLPENEEVQIAVRGRSILVRGGDLTLSSLLVEGIFPKYQQVIPKDNNRDAGFKRDALMAGLRKAQYLTTEETKSVVIKFATGSCVIEARSPDKGVATVDVEVDYKGEEMAIAFNPQFMMESLKVIGTDTVKLELKDGSKPGILREGPEYLYVLMPVSPKD